MLAIESARIVKDESPRHTKGVSHLVIDGSREAEAFATILVAEHDRRDMRLPGARRVHYEDRRLVSLIPETQRFDVAGSIAGMLDDQRSDSNAVAEQTSAEGCDDALHGAGL